MSVPQASRDRAVELRDAFDRIFAAPPQERAEESDDLLAIRLRGDPYAIRLGDIGGMTAFRSVTPVPGAGVSLLGLAGIRGAIVPVFRLATVVGYPAAAEDLKWLILCRGDDPAALAIADFEGLARVATGSLHAATSAFPDRQHIRQVAQTSSGVRPVLSLPHIMQSLREQAGPAVPAQE